MTSFYDTQKFNLHYGSLLVGKSGSSDGCMNDLNIVVHMAAAYCMHALALMVNDTGPQLRSHLRPLIDSRQSHRVTETR
jgi:hypothetical protein